MFEVVNECAHTVAERLQNYVDATADAKNGARLNIMDWTWRVSLDTIGRVAFDHDFGCGESEDAKALHRTWIDQTNASMDRTGIIVSFVES